MGRKHCAPTIYGDLSVGARGDHRHRIAPTSAQINLEIVAIIFEIGIKFIQSNFIESAPAFLFYLSFSCVIMFPIFIKYVKTFFTLTYVAANQYLRQKL